VIPSRPPFQHSDGNRYFVVRDVRGVVVEATSRVARLAGFRAVFGREPVSEVELLERTPVMFCPGELVVGGE